MQSSEIQQLSYSEVSVGEDILSAAVAAAK